MYKFKSKNPIIEDNGVVWDYYFLMNLVISTNIDDGTQSCYAEFYPCRYFEDIIRIKNNCSGSEVKSLQLDSLGDSGEAFPEIGMIRDGIIDLLDVLGKMNNLFE